MENLKLFFRVYINPAATMSDIMDRGNWMFAAVAVLVVSSAFYATVNMRLAEAYRIRSFSEFYQPGHDEAAERTNYDRAIAAYERETAERPKVPLVGDAFFFFFDLEPTKFYQPLLLLSVFYVPAAILLMCIFGKVGSFGLVLRRDYGTLAMCTLFAWSAGHFPFAAVGLLLSSMSLAPPVYLGFWLAGGLLFGVFMVFALRTVFGANYGVAILVVSLGWLAMSGGVYIFQYVSPWLFSPFILFFLVLHFGGFLGGEMRGFRNAFRQKQNLNRFLQNATVNPRDADAHVQLGLIYQQRRQVSKAVEHLEKALEIDKDEIDANYEMGKIARSRGELQKALDHFAVVLGQDDKHALSEIWRDIGATYLAANMLSEARDALEKFVDRRSADVEGLYYLGKVRKAQGESDRAREIFREAIEFAASLPDFRRGSMNRWRRLAQKEL